MRVLFVLLRIIGVIIGLAAVIGQVITTSNFWDAQGYAHKGNAFVNFFSFFTIDSNLAAIAVFAIGAVCLVRNTADPRWFALLRASAVTYMTVTFVVYNLLLRGISLPQGATLGWSNEILHVVAPLLILLDWFFAPGRARLEWKELRVIIAFPIIWVIYTLIRGPLAFDDARGIPTWYPYPFLNPATSPEGYFSVAFYIVLIAGMIIGTGAGVIWVSRRRARWPLRSVAA